MREILQENTTGKNILFRTFRNICFLLVIGLSSCGGQPAKESINEKSPANWAETEAQAKGQQLTMAMWQGDALINKYMQNFVVPELKSKYGIDLKIVSGQGQDLVKTIMNETETAKSESAYDLMWINGETFFQLREINALFGPFTDQLPNNQFIDWNNIFINTDFQHTVNGFECPWGNVQFSFIYNSEKVATPPVSLEELAAWVQQNPGKFTIPNDFAGMTLLKSWLIHFAGGGSSLNGKFDAKKYAESSAKLWAYINQIKPYFWKEGETFPQNVTQMHQLFANGEVWFTMSNNDNEVDNKIAEGLFTSAAKGYIFENGSIQNSHYLGISRTSAHKSVALVVCNFLISPEAQYEKLKTNVWGDGTVLATDKLPDNWKEKFSSLTGRTNALPRAVLNEKALMEPDPQYMINVMDDFRKFVIEK
jgi:putative spermidine/putrescine transport system substrate-binding protein